MFAQVAAIALVLIVLYLALTFGARTWLHRRRTGASGFAGFSERPGSAAWFAGVSFSLAILLGLAAPLLELIAGTEPLGPLEETWVRVLGIPIFLVGAAATIYAQEAMGRSWRIGVDAEERTELVTDGPFRWVRNPIFTAMLIAGLGLFLMVGNVVAMLSLSLLIAGLEGQVRLVEEPHLLQSHGDAYRTYAASSGRFWPAIGRLAPPKAR